MASAPKPRSLTLTPTLNGHGRITELNMDTDPGMQRVKKTWLRFVFSSQKTREEGMQNNLSNTHKKNKGKSNKISSK